MKPFRESIFAHQMQTFTNAAWKLRKNVEKSSLFRYLFGHEEEISQIVDDSDLQIEMSKYLYGKSRSFSYPEIRKELTAVFTKYVSNQDMIQGPHYERLIQFTLIHMVDLGRLEYRSQRYIPVHIYSI